MAALNGPIVLDTGPNPLISRSQFFAVSTGPLDLSGDLRPARAGGIEYQIAHCDLPLCYEVECISAHNSKTLNNQFTLITGDPFVVYSSIRCAPVGLTDERLKRALFEQLMMGEQARVEATFSEQACGQSPGLSGNPDTVNLGVAGDIVSAVSQLEDFLYSQYSAPGVLHVPYAFSAYFENLHLAERMDSAGVWRTKLGTKVNFGNYSSLSPTGGDPAAGTGYIYITGQTAVWRTPDAELFVTSRRDVLNRTTNQLTAVMEREYVVTFDCAVGGIRAPLSGVVL